MLTRSQFQAPGAGAGRNAEDEEEIETRIRGPSISSGLENILLMRGVAEMRREEEEERSETSSLGACSSSSAEEEEEEEVQSKPISLSISLAVSGVNENEDEDEDEDETENRNERRSEKSSLSSLESLEESLPFKRGLSNFYSGKSKSFTCLSSAANATAKDIVKPENPLNKRRRLFIARSRSRRASCSSLVSIVESPLDLLQPLLPPDNISECDEEDEEEESLDQADEASPSPSPSPSSSDVERLTLRRSHTLRQREGRPSLFTVSVSPFEGRPDHHDPFPTPKSMRASTSGGSKMPLKSLAIARSLSLSDISRHAHPDAHPVPAID